MARNDQNLTHKLTKGEQSKGGRASGETRRKRKAVRAILSDFIGQKIRDTETVRKVAYKLGVEDEQTIEELFVAVCVMNTLKQGDLSDLERLTKLLGEDSTTDSTEQEQKQAELLGAIKEAVTGKK